MSTPLPITFANLPVGLNPMALFDRQFLASIDGAYFLDGTVLSAALASVVAAGSAGDASHVPSLTVNAKGQITALFSNLISVPVSSLNNLGAGVAAWLAVPSSANLAAAVTGETGTGALVFATSPALVTPNIGAAAGASLNLSGLTASSSIATDAGNNLVSVTDTGTGNNVLATSPTLTTPNIGAATGLSLVASGVAGIGYATGAGGAVTQATSKATGVALNTASGQITMNNAALAASTIVSFVLTDTSIAATDVLILNHLSGGTVGSYTLNAQAAAGSATINVRNNTGGSLSEAIVIAFAIIKAVIA